MSKGEHIMIQRVGKFAKVSLNQYRAALGFQDLESEYQTIKLPKRATKGSAGHDFYSPKTFSLAQGETITIATGIRSEIADGWVLFILPRSGHGFKFRVQLDNTVGVIDSDYFYSDNEGHIMLKLTNDGKMGKTMCIQAGEAIAQGIFVPFGITMDDNVKEVRNGGLGSTTTSNWCGTTTV
jgi:dUTP pyrophosphatase